VSQLYENRIRISRVRGREKKDSVAQGKGAAIEGVTGSGGSNRGEGQGVELGNEDMWTVARGKAFLALFRVVRRAGLRRRDRAGSGAG
jgi:hypothetical protein